MDIFNKIKESVQSSVSNTIQNTVYNTGTIISGALPGNPVTRDFEVTAHIASAGPGLMWKVYSGFKKSTKQPASVFVFEKSLLDRFDKQEKELLLDLVRKGVAQLTRLRHPQILTVQHPLEESRDCLAFATEQVLASLANIIGQQVNLPTPVPEQLRDFNLFDVEIKYGLLQVSEGLGFLHNSVKMLHRNISPESIVVNHQGAWKIFGFDYCIANSGLPDQAPSWRFPEYDHSVPPEGYPDLDYTAPEFAALGSCDTTADIFSFGMLCFSVYNKKPLYQCNRNWGVYKRNVAELRNIPASRLQKLPNDLKECIKLMLSSTPNIRPTPEQVSQLPYFEDVGVKTLTNLDSQFQWDNVQKSQFYKGLPTILPKLPHRVACHRVFPCLAKEFVNHDMVPFVLPSALQIAEEASEKDYVELILPHLKAVMKISEPVQVLLIFMQRMDLLLAKTPPAHIKTDVLPMIYRAIESDASQIQELCLTIIPSFAGILDRQILKTALLPRIKKLCLSTTLLSVRVNSLICVGKLIDHMDKWQVIDDVLPMFHQIPSKEPAVIMAIVGIYKLTLNNSKIGLTKEVMAAKVLPFVIPLSIENGLSLSQFDSVMGLIRDLLGRIESDHRVKLEQLASIKNEQKSALQLSMSENLTLPPGQLVSAPSAQQASSMDSMFSGLGLGSYVSQDKSSLVNKMLVEDNNKNLAPAPGMSKSASSQGLSLQEKQRLLREQENAQKRSSPSPSTTSLPQQSNGIPRSSSLHNQRDATSLNNKTTDLTSTLVNKSLALNMNQMNKPGVSLMPQAAPTSNNQWVMSGATSFGGILPNQTNSGGIPTNQTMSQPAAFSPAFGVSQMGAASQMRGSQPKPNLSAFDNLMTPTSKPAVPMNSMAPQRLGAPTLMQHNSPHSGFSQPSAIKPLSSTDLADFLS